MNQKWVEYSGLKKCKIFPIQWVKKHSVAKKIDQRSINDHDDRYKKFGIINKQQVKRTSWRNETDNQQTNKQFKWTIKRQSKKKEKKKMTKSNHHFVEMTERDWPVVSFIYFDKINPEIMMMIIMIEETKWSTNWIKIENYNFFDCFQNQKRSRRKTKNGCCFITCVTIFEKMFRHQKNVRFCQCFYQSGVRTRICQTKQNRLKHLETFSVLIDIHIYRSHPYQMWKWWWWQWKHWKNWQNKTEKTSSLNEWINNKWNDYYFWMQFNDCQSWNKMFWLLFLAMIFVSFFVQKQMFVSINFSRDFHHHRQQQLKKNETENCSNMADFCCHFLFDNFSQLSFFLI